MTRIVEFDISVVDGNDMRILCKIIPQISSMFSSRKNYDEYYFRKFETDFTLEQLERLSEEYRVILSCEYLRILLT